MEAGKKLRLGISWNAATMQKLRLRRGMYAYDVMGLLKSKKNPRKERLAAVCYNHFKIFLDSANLPNWEGTKMELTMN